MSMAELRDLVIVISGILGILVFIVIAVLALTISRQVRLAVEKLKTSAAGAAWVAVVIQGIFKAIGQLRKTSIKKGKRQAEGG